MNNLLKVMLIAILLFYILLPTAQTLSYAKQSVDNHDDSIQKEVRAFYNTLNADEKEQLRLFAKTNAANFSLSNTDFMDGLKEQSYGLFAKLSGLRDIINEKLATMEPESRIFIEKVLRKFLAAFGESGLMNIVNALKGIGYDILNLFDGLSSSAQRDVLKAFPTIATFATSDVVRLILKKVAEFSISSRGWTPAPTVELDTDHTPSPRRKIPVTPSKYKQEPGDDLKLDGDEDDSRVKKMRTTTIYPPLDIEEPFEVRHSGS